MWFETRMKRFFFGNCKCQSSFTSSSNICCFFFLFPLASHKLRLEGELNKNIIPFVAECFVVRLIVVCLLLIELISLLCTFILWGFCILNFIWGTLIPGVLSVTFYQLVLLWFGEIGKRDVNTKRFYLLFFHFS